MKFLQRKKYFAAFFILPRRARSYAEGVCRLGPPHWGWGDVRKKAGPASRIVVVARAAFTDVQMPEEPPRTVPIPEPHPPPLCFFNGTKIKWGPKLV